MEARISPYGQAGILPKLPIDLLNRRAALQTNRFKACLSNERFSSGGLAGLKDMDGFGELTGAAGAAGELAQDPPALELAADALAARAEPGMGAVGVLL